MKTPIELKLIFYRIGEGGTFLTKLFSLSNNTRFLWKTGTCNCKPKDHSFEEKLKYYSYTDSIQHWMTDAHLTPYGTYLLHDIFNKWETNSILITCIHYDQYQVHDFESHFPINAKYFYIKISDELRKKMKLEVKATGHIDSPEIIEKIMNTLDPLAIDMDLLMDNDNSFIEEYRRICSLMDLEPIDNISALDFYHNWKKQRQLKGRKSNW